MPGLPAVFLQEIGHTPDGIGGTADDFLQEGNPAAPVSLVNAVMLRTLPVNEPERLVQITRELDGRPGRVSYPLFEQFRDHIQSISGALAQQSSDETLTLGGEEEQVAVDVVSGSYFAVLGIEAAAGRVLGPADDEQSPLVPAAVISDRYWQRRFGGKLSAIGSTFTVRDRTFTIVGVTPPRYRGARVDTPPDVFLPLQPMMTDVQRTQLGFNWLNLLARLKPGATLEQARAEAEVLYRPMLQAQAAESPGRADRDVPRRAVGARAHHVRHRRERLRRAAGLFAISTARLLPFRSASFFGLCRNCLFLSAATLLRIGRALHFGIGLAGHRTRAIGSLDCAPFAAGLNCHGKRHYH